MDLSGKKGLIVGLADEHSLAFGCADACISRGAEVLLTCRAEKSLPALQPLADTIGAVGIEAMDVTRETDMDRVFAAIGHRWGRLDFLIHSIAWCNRQDLHGRVVDCSAAGFAEAMDVSCHSFLRLARRAVPLMHAGGSLLTMSFAGSRQVVPTYGLMGPVKAALECAVRYLAADLGPDGIRVNALSPGPVATRAAGGLAEFDLLLGSTKNAPVQPPAGLAETGAWAAFLASDAGRGVTGAVIDIDQGLSMMSGMNDG
ncbi:enoyl-ACP reductase FabI [Aquisalinus flavus]|uniref:Enoyl-[acyl-carrier-protein] reductase [NADH] n=1 Tax=Aquisalinus flavus TaxID=1526572 RepID=A0A8J2V7M4_9PROT|nr:enoyl-ACP reductase FabI [Aquisalinus flavus]MBD0426031.1 enoyl-ACP reductase FabI [Aquisalinus flavus]UNE48378.1 enoyl-ACP reductase FabI [Aquisalinus flavus]GGD11276.1 enoyl-[acyl-carrier-protein] reductase [NADH] [Aquisalinus flavus]